MESRKEMGDGERGIDYWSQNMQSRDQTVNLSESSKLKAYRFCMALPGITPMKSLGGWRDGPNASPCTPTAGFRTACVLLSRCIKRLSATTTRRRLDPRTDKWAASRAEWQIEAPDSSGWGEITRRPTAPSGTTAQYFSVNRRSKPFGQTIITAMKSVLSFYAYVVSPRRVMRAPWTNRQICATFCKENVSLLIPKLLQYI